MCSESIISKKMSEKIKSGAQGRKRRKEEEQKKRAISHIAIFLWPSSGPHNQLSLGPHTAMTYGPSVDQVWIPEQVPNLAQSRASYG